MAFTYSDIKQRVQDLIGQPDGTISDFNKRNINRSIRQILNEYKFSWNLTTTTITLSGGTANLPADYNPLWHLEDARIVNTSTNDDNVLKEIPVWQRDGSNEYVYWITYDTTNDVYVFNSNTQTGTVTIHYNFLPADLSADADKCVIPDLEAVAYLAASKNWVGAERDVDLKREYETEANRFITALYVKDMESADPIALGSVVGLDVDLTGGTVQNHYVHRY